MKMKDNDDEYERHLKAFKDEIEVQGPMITEEEEEAYEDVEQGTTTTQT